MGKNKDFFSPDEEQAIVSAIKKAEKNCSGEIRVHLEDKSQDDNLNRAKQLFKELGMTNTELRNGVLFYLNTKDHKFSILGDQGINEIVGDSFWNSTVELVQAHFKKSEFVLGLSNGIEKAGEVLKKHFPYQSNDENELSDEISKS